MKNAWLIGGILLVIASVIAWTSFVPKKDIGALIPHGSLEKPLTSK